MEADAEVLEAGWLTERDGRVNASTPRDAESSRPMDSFIVQRLTTGVTENNDKDRRTYEDVRSKIRKILRSSIASVVSLLLGALLSG